ncbi:Cas10/Cmr2 second palm domain-containing protein [Aequitasia blattaphilus]|uniref:Cas10/Cmr2 second palm domain-containing protein n=1 Tax=Aequitasia blattaphilus TaxID=2949332 RepID=A0ABT1E877_9FIRM|nr:hypothetical protein [Aequitasia blattaphilus]MCP1102035.1 hypothetical protein [Aequitasia blattaphilus]MCR8614675.1 hypothetical protein [Aequitasia blattaphilus]
MKTQIVALSIDKVQTVLFDVIQGHEQEKQTEEKTLKQIMSASQEISNDFHKAIEEKFEVKEADILIACSGVFIFSCEISVESIEKKLNELFAEYYESSQGKKKIRFTYFEKNEMTDINVIQEAKKRLKSNREFSQVIEKNSDKLFAFKKGKKANESEVDRGEFPYFSRTINDLYYSESGEDGEAKKRFRIAVIKADLDGMGDMFKGITKYKRYKDISVILNERVSLDFLHKVAEEHAPSNQKEWVFPLYMAGDDMFFAVYLPNLVRGIDVCRDIMERINEKLDVSPEQKLSMSVGVSITFNKEPIRYYLDMVEEQLACAKQAELDKCESQILPNCDMKIAINKIVFFDINREQVKKQKKLLGPKKTEEKQGINRIMDNNLNWSFFVDDLNLIDKIRQDEETKDKIGTTSFFYGLLQKITKEEVANNLEYMIQLMYHLQIQNTNESRLYETELLLKWKIIKLIYKRDARSRKGRTIHLGNKKIKQQFESYLRLLLLFSDERFGLIQKSKVTKIKLKSENKKQIQQELFMKPIHYIHDLLIPKYGKELVEIFVKIVPFNKTRKIKSEYVQCLSIDKSMFFNLRKIEKVSIEKAAYMIGLKNDEKVKEISNEEEEDIKEIDGQGEEEEKNPYKLYFDREGFLTYGMKKWDANFVDAIMLIYEYNDKLIKYKSFWNNKKEGNKNER